METENLIQQENALLLEIGQHVSVQLLENLHPLQQRSGIKYIYLCLEEGIMKSTLLFLPSIMWLVHDYRNLLTTCHQHYQQPYILMVMLPPSQQEFTPFPTFIISKIDLWMDWKLTIIWNNGGLPISKNIKSPIFPKQNFKNAPTILCLF